MADTPTSQNEETKVGYENAESLWAPLHRVTSVSKVTAAIVFIALPFIGFYLGYAVKLKSSQSNLVADIYTEKAPAQNDKQNIPTRAIIDKHFEEKSQDRSVEPFNSVEAEGVMYSLEQNNSSIYLLESYKSPVLRRGKIKLEYWEMPGSWVVTFIPSEPELFSVSKPQYILATSGLNADMLTDLCDSGDCSDNKVTEWEVELKVTKVKSMINSGTEAVSSLEIQGWEII